MSAKHLSYADYSSRSQESRETIRFNSPVIHRRNGDTSSLWPRNGGEIAPEWLRNRIQERDKRPKTGKDATGKNIFGDEVKVL